MQSKIHTATVAEAGIVVQNPWMIFLGDGSWRGRVRKKEGPAPEDWRNIGKGGEMGGKEGGNPSQVHPPPRGKPSAKKAALDCHHGANMEVNVAEGHK